MIKFKEICFLCFGVLVLALGLAIGFADSHYTAGDARIISPSVASRILGFGGCYPKRKYGDYVACQDPNGGCAEWNGDEMGCYMHSQCIYCFSNKAWNFCVSGGSLWLENYFFEDGCGMKIWNDHCTWYPLDEICSCDGEIQEDGCNRNVCATCV